MAFFSNLFLVHMEVGVGGWGGGGNMTNWKMTWLNGQSRFRFKTQCGKLTKLSAGILKITRTARKNKNNVNNDNTTLSARQVVAA